MARIKFADEKVDKGVQQVTQTRKKETMTKVTTGEVKPNQIKENQFVFTSIKKGQIGPSEPPTDQSRIYFKDSEGNTFMFTGTKVS
jgi:hypothetical protein|tara:strand:+ start:1079 stop:1336 length:258 start_codon:yes stop_codon:yes gene_type:complete